MSGNHQNSVCLANPKAYPLSTAKGKKLCSRIHWQKIARMCPCTFLIEVYCSTLIHRKGHNNMPVECMSHISRLSSWKLKSDHILSKISKYKASHQIPFSSSSMAGVAPASSTKVTFWIRVKFDSELLSTKMAICCQCQQGQVNSDNSHLIVTKLPKNCPDVQKQAEQLKIRM